MTQTIRDQIIGIIARQAVLSPADIRMDATLDDLGIDSLGLVESIFSIEETFDITVPFNANDPTDTEFDISTVATMIAAVEGMIAAQK